MKNKIWLTILIPAYNEAKIIKNTLDKICKYLKNKDFEWEIVVSDDGSRDDTSSIVKKYKSNKIRLVSSAKNRGKGAALKTGVMASKGDYIIFMDADLSVPLSTTTKFVNEFKNGAEVVVASRRVKGAIIEVHQPWHREAMGKVYTKLTQLITGVTISDFTCGFKGFSKSSGRKIFGKSVVNRWAYDSEIMFLAKKYGYEIFQVPIKWKNREDTRVKLRQVVVESFLDLLNVRLNDLKGLYDN
jgi:dolichyl-phosphate beta-glucosyltransferase